MIYILLFTIPILRTEVKEVREPLVVKEIREPVRMSFGQSIYPLAPHPVTERIKKAKGTVLPAYISSPHPYWNSMDISYKVYGPPENVWMTIHFDTIDVESGYDTVFVYDNDGDLVDYFTGAYGPTWTSWGDGPTFTVRIKSDASVTKYGFDVNYIQVGGWCGPYESPHPYLNNMDTTVYMSGPANDWIGELIFYYDSIKTEYSYDSVFCYDIDSSTVLNTWTGTHRGVWSEWSSYNQDYTKQPTEATRLKSDGSITDYGWYSDWYNFFREHNVESPHNYPDYANQAYFIYGPQDAGDIRMRLHFARLETEYSYDSVYVYDGNGNLVNTYTGSAGTNFWTSWGDGNYMKVVLKSDNSVTRWGFEIDSLEWEPASMPNLTYYTPDGWDGPIVPSSEPNTHTYGPNLMGDSTTYIDWAIINNGSDTAFYFYIYLYCDDIPIAGWYCDTLPPNYYAYVEDYIDTFTAGTHTLKIYADTTDTVDESDETDNIYSQSFSWASGGGGGGAPGDTEYVIITPEEFRSAFSDLIWWKTKKGVPTAVMPVETIYKYYSGTDNAEKIRNYIIDAVNRGVIYVVLAGQCDFEHGEEYVPRRDAYCMTSDVGYYSDEDTIPCDLYYADLDGTWDYDGDGVYGETTDQVDMYADVYVGRFPVKNTTQISSIVQKILAYEKNPDPDYIRKILLPVGNLWSTNHGNGINDTIADTVPDTWKKAKLYEDYGLLSRYTVFDSINSGFSMGHWVGHGNEYGIYYDYGSEIYYYYSDVGNQTNPANNTIFVNSIACFMGALDEAGSSSGYDCVAEVMVNSNTSCAIGTGMNTRYGWGYSSPEGALGPSGELSVWFYRKLFGTSLYRLGEVFFAAKDQLVPTASSDDYFRWVLYEHALFGDPETPIWTDIPVALSVTHPAEIEVGNANQCTVKVYTAKAPVEDALVTLATRDFDVYLRDTTDINGEAVFTVNPSREETVFVTVTGENLLPYEGYILAKTTLSLNFITAMAYFIGEGIMFRWVVMDENTERWEIERKEKGKEYRVIARIPGRRGSGRHTYSYLDTDIEKGKTYSYRLRAVGEGKKKVYGPFLASTGPVALRLGIERVYPLPSAGAVTVIYTVPQKEYVCLTLYDGAGRKVKKIKGGVHKAGYHRAKFTIEHPGVYFLRIENGRVSDTEKIVIVK